MMIEDKVESVKSLAKSFKNAFRGIQYCIRNERNMRIHLTAAAYVLSFSGFYCLSSTQYILLLIVIGMVLFAEAVNTAIEASVNLQIQCYDSLAKIAKDTAAGAVLISAVFAAAVGIILFLKVSIILKIIFFLLSHPLWGGIFILSLPLSGIFIFCFPFRHFRKIPKHRKTKKSADAVGKLKKSVQEDEN